MRKQDIPTVAADPGAPAAPPVPAALPAPAMPPAAEALTTLTLLKPALDERELITARYSEPVPGQDRAFRTLEIVYPATATDDEIWQRAQRAVFGVDCLRAATRQLDSPAADVAPATGPVASPVPGAPALLRPGASGIRPGGTITDKQLKAIYAIARAARHLSEPEVEVRVQELYHCRPSELSKVEASQFIDILKSAQAA